MELSRIRANSKLYVRILLGVTVCVVFALIITSSVFYYTYTKILQKEAYESDLHNLNQTSQAVAQITEVAQTVSFQIYRNSAISNLLFYRQPDAFDQRKAMLDLMNYLATMPFIQSIYVYKPDSENFYIASRSGQAGIISENELTDDSIMDILGNFQSYKPFTPIPRILKHSPQTPASGVYTYLIYDAIGLKKQINSAVIVNISADWINRELKFVGHESGRTFLIDDLDHILSVDDLTAAQLAAKDSELLKKTQGWRRKPAISLRNSRASNH